MPELRYFVRSCCVVIAIALTAVSLGSCALAKNQMEFDRPAEKSVQDYRDALSPLPEMPAEEANSNTPPDFQPIVAMPADLKLPTPLVTVSVNQTVSLSDLLFELAEQADVDLELDQQIKGSLIFTARERPFSEVIERICSMAGLRYKFQNNVLRVEVDRPYIKNYKVDYMNIGRKSGSSIKSDLSVSGGDKSVTSGTSSSANIANTFSSNLWKEVDDGLKQLLAASDTAVSMASASGPTGLSALPSAASKGGAATPPPLPPAGAAAAPGGAPAKAAEPLTATYSISKETGIISVFANERQHKLVRQFLEDFRRVSTMQILIEAKVLEVSLSDEFTAGIDWGSIDITGLSTVQASFAAPDMATPSLNIFKANFDFGRGVKPVINALSRFGTVRALSSPRVTVMNSQPAVVNVTSNSIYFDIVTTTIPATAVGVPPTITKTATVKSAPEGVLMNVLPTANPDTNEILLAIRPTVSKVTRQIADPVNVGNSIPELSVQEIDSVVKIQSGQTLIMGGLMKDENVASREGVPVMESLPVLGALFRNHGDRVEKSELVILLRATVVPSSYVPASDGKLFKDFSMDRRP